MDRGGGGSGGGSCDNCSPQKVLSSGEKNRSTRRNSIKSVLTELCVGWHDRKGAREPVGKRRNIVGRTDIKVELTSDIRCETKRPEGRAGWHPFCPRSDTKLSRTSHGIVGEMLIFKFSFGTRTIVVYVRLHLALKYWCCTEERLNTHKVSV